jgi:FkbM family methyltransferase
MSLRNLVPSLQGHMPFETLRNAYLRTCKPDYWKDHDGALRKFYARFLQPGALVFDIGANCGDYAKTFLHLGARVVAVEPVPNLARQLERLGCLAVVEKAVGENECVMQLHISNHSDLSSLSADWLDVTKDNDGWQDVPQWTSTIDVPVTTLDRLIAEHGMPEYIKIDVEGFELSALRGLTKAPRLLSFEFNSNQTDQAIACVNHLAGSQFNYVVGVPRRDTTFALPKFVDAKAMIAAIQTLRDRKTFGDIFVAHHGEIL